MKTIRFAGVGLSLCLALGLAGFILLFARQPVLAAPPTDAERTESAVPENSAVPFSVQMTTTITRVYTYTTSKNISLGCVTPTLNVADDLYLYSVRTGVKITHTNRGDISMTLLSPANVPVRVLNSNNAITSENLNVLFDPFSTVDPETPPGDGDHDPSLSYYQYTWRPVDDLDLFRQGRSQGNWRLRICDVHSNGKTGKLKQWTLELELGPAIADLSTSFMDAPVEAAISSTVVSPTIWYNINIQNSGALTAANVSLRDVLPQGVTYITGSLVCGSGCWYDSQTSAIQWSGDIAPFAMEQIHFEVVPSRYGLVENVAHLAMASSAYDLWSATEVFPEIYEYWNFEGSDGGFLSGSGWNYGILLPGDIPISPGNGPEMWATGLSDDYDDSSIATLTKTVDLSTIPATTALFLRWWEYYSFADDDVGVILANGDLLETIQGNSGNEWLARAVDLSPYIGQNNVTLVWKVVPNHDAVVDKGWYIDDVSIHAGAPATDLAVSTEASSNPAVIGGPLSYTVTMKNLGNYTATYVIMDDDLPPEVHLTGIITPVSRIAVCAEAPAGHVHCDYGSLRPGQAVTVVLTTDVLSGVGQPGDQIVNSVSARAAENETDPYNNAVTLRTLLVDIPLTAPRVYSVTPASAVIPLTGKPIYIDGDNFTQGMSAYLDGYELRNVTRITSRRLAARVPYTVPTGTHDLTVIASNGERGVLLDAFTVLGSQPPALQRVLPGRGLSGVPTNIFVLGENFSPDSALALYQGAAWIADIEGVVFISQNKLRGVVPGNISPGLYDMRVSDARGAVTVPDAYEVVDPLSFDDLFAVNTFDLWMRPPVARQADTVTVSINVRRRGGQSALSNIPVDYYWDAPSVGAGGTPIGTPLVGTLLPRSASTAALTWTLNVSPAVRTFYAVIDPQNVIAEADETNNIISRTIRIWPPGPDYSPPVIDRFTINWGAGTAYRPQVWLNLTTVPTATFVLYMEYQYIQSENAWMQVASSGWLPFDDASVNYPWRLQAVPGIHYIQAWVADEHGNVCLHPGLAYINLMSNRAHLAAGEVHIYRRTFAPGNYLARLSLINGETDFYVWAPDGSRLVFVPTNNTYYEVPFSIPVTGTYQIEFEGYTSADYRFDVAPSSAPPAQPPAPLNVAMPMPRGRGVGINNAEPNEGTGLPNVPVDEMPYRLYFPTIFR